MNARVYCAEYIVLCERVGVCPKTVVCGDPPCVQFWFSPLITHARNGPQKTNTQIEYPNSTQKKTEAANPDGPVGPKIMQKLEETNPKGSHAAQNTETLEETNPSGPRGLPTNRRKQT